MGDTRVFFNHKDNPDNILYCEYHEHSDKYLVCNGAWWFRIDKMTGKTFIETLHTDSWEEQFHGKEIHIQHMTFNEPIPKFRDYNEACNWARDRVNTV